MYRYSLLPDWWPSIFAADPLSNGVDLTAYGVAGGIVAIALTMAGLYRQDLKEANARADRAEARRDAAEERAAKLQDDRHREDQLMLARTVPTLERTVGAAQAVEERVRTAPLSKTLADLQRAVDELRSPNG